VAGLQNQGEEQAGLQSISNSALVWEALIANANADANADADAQPSLDEASEAGDAAKPLFGSYEAGEVDEAEVGDVLL